MGVDYPSLRLGNRSQDNQDEAWLMSPDDFIITLSVNDLDYLRTALRNESARLRQQGFDGLRAHTDNLRDKISNQMIDQAQARIDKRVSV
jgi:hypothetical protein